MLHKNCFDAKFISTRTGYEATLLIDLGFKTFIEREIKFRGIDYSENNEENIKQKNLVISILSTARELSVFCIDELSDGTYEGNVFCKNDVDEFSSNIIYKLKLRG